MRVVLLLLLSAAAVTVEHVSTKPERSEGLGTCGYASSEKERPFLGKVGAKDHRTGGYGESYSLEGHESAFVGWFGIVRGVKEEHGSTRLELEHKGLDGMSDCHILALDFNGSGDFTAVIPGTGHHIETLTLVKVYGTVAKKNGSQPLVNAAFVRNWHQGTFTFLMAASEQHGSEAWRKLNTVPLEQIYDPYPDAAYYVKRLGKR